MHISPPFLSQIPSKQKDWTAGLEEATQTLKNPPSKKGKKKKGEKKEDGQKNEIQHCRRRRFA